MALIIYGSPRSRTLRTFWAAEELGLAYEHVPIAWDDPALKTPAFLALNPAGTIPIIVDDGVALAESLPINLYLAKRYGSAGPAPLYPAGLEGEAGAWRWSLWAQAHLEPWVQRDAWSAPVRETAAEVLAAARRRGLGVLQTALAGHPWLLGEVFTVADLNVAGVLSPSRSSDLPLTDYPQVQAWLGRCYDRPAARAVRARFA
jgi:glutathione S-transferase